MKTLLNFGMWEDAILPRIIQEDISCLSHSRGAGEVHPWPRLWVQWFICPSSRALDTQGIALANGDRLVSQRTGRNKSRFAPSWTWHSPTTPRRRDNLSLFSFHTLPVVFPGKVEYQMIPCQTHKSPESLNGWAVSSHQSWLGRLNRKIPLSSSPAPRHTHRCTHSPLLLRKIIL